MVNDKWLMIDGLICFFRAYINQWLNVVWVHAHPYAENISPINYYLYSPCMIQSVPKDLVPLTGDDKDFLLLIFKKRRLFLVMVYMALIAAAIFMGLSFYGMDTLRNLYVPKENTKYPSTLGLRVASVVFVLLILLVSGIYFYIRRVLTYKKDAVSGLKERLAYTIVRKEYFPMTNQYYVMFDDPAYPHHETDEETWYNCYEGGYFFIYRAVRSKFVFNDTGKVAVI